MTEILKGVNAIFHSAPDDNDRDDSSSDLMSVDSESNQTKHEVERVKKLVSEEALRVQFGRMLVFLTLLGTGTVVCVLVFAVLLFQNESDIEDEFDSMTVSLNEAFNMHMNGVVQSNEELSNIVTTESMKNNESFPHMMVDFFEGYASDVRDRAHTDLVMYAPLTRDVIGWQNFSVSNEDWIDESLAIFAQMEPDSELSVGAPMEPNDGVIKTMGEDGTFVPSESVDGNYLPLLHYSPPLASVAHFWNYDFYSEEHIRSAAVAAVASGETAFSPFSTLFSGFRQDHGGHHNDHDNSHHSAPSESALSVSVYPVYNTYAKSAHDAVGFVLMSLDWSYFFADMASQDVNCVRVFVNNSCGQSAAYDVVNGKATFYGFDVEYDQADYYRASALHETIYMGMDPERSAARLSIQGQCTPFLEVRALKAFPEGHGSSFRYTMTLGIAASYALMAVVFFVFDRQTKLQDEKMVQFAAQSNQVLASLFPSNVRDRLLNNPDEKMKDEDTGGHGAPLDGNSTTGGSSAAPDKNNVIADLYPETTILFADIAGFTAWSSMQEPKQVFILLETIFKAFDDIAKKRRVFKVETVGDCYVAAVGLPTPRRDHAVVMARFARDCMYKMWRLSKDLEVQLGPESGHLAVRMGMHSGPVTAGILRGDRARFQLFGDTMNTASRIESTGLPNCIHVSAETAELLIASGKSQWIKPRDDTVTAKGKGELKTYWLELGASVDAQASLASEDSKSFSASADSMNDALERNEMLKSKKEEEREDKYKRLIDWNVDMLTRLLRQMARRRKPGKVANNFRELSLLSQPGKSTIDEVKEIIYLGGTSTAKERESTDVDPEALTQLRYYVTSVCAMYRANAFHNFEHASHVVMSVTKLLARIAQDKADDAKKDLRDPLTQFACAFSALIHDLDHPGVPNARLIEERDDLARFYNGKAIAEQNSLELAFGLLMDSQFESLRKAIYTNEHELKLFRELVINSVMATDIVDKDLKALRNARWEKAFSPDAEQETHPVDAVHRKATIVVEHLIQASDVAHTMQHWMVYRRWNERFFEECYKAYKDGRADSDPSENWYKGELGFFDFYIIPLAKKLKDCGVFGVSSDEYLDYAQKNRDEWERQGQACVEAMVEKVKNKF